MALPALPLVLRRARDRAVSAIAFDGACLRGKCEADHDLGYELMQRIAQVIIERLQATRLRLLDVYGVGVARVSAPRAATRCSRSGSASRHEQRDRRHLDAHLEPLDRPEPLAFAPGQFNMVYAFGAGEVPISISGDPSQPAALVHTVRAVGAATRAICAAEPGHGARASGAVRKRLADATSADEADVVIVAGGVGLAPVRPIVYEVLARRDRLAELSCSTEAASPLSSSLRPSSTWRERGLEVDFVASLAPCLELARKEELGGLAPSVQHQCAAEAVPVGEHRVDDRAHRRQPDSARDDHHVGALGRLHRPRFRTARGRRARPGLGGADRPRRRADGADRVDQWPGLDRSPLIEIGTSPTPNA